MLLKPALGGNLGDCEVGIAQKALGRIQPRGVDAGDDGLPIAALKAAGQIIFADIKVCRHTVQCQFLGAVLNEVIPHRIEPVGREGAGVSRAGAVGDNLGQQCGNLGTGVQFGRGIPPLCSAQHGIQMTGNAGSVRRCKHGGTVPKQAVESRRAAAVEVDPAQFPRVMRGAAVTVRAAAVHPEALPGAQRIVPPAVLQRTAARCDLNNEVAVQTAALKSRMAAQQADVAGFLHIEQVLPRKGARRHNGTQACGVIGIGKLVLYRHGVNLLIARLCKNTGKKLPCIPYKIYYTILEWFCKVIFAPSPAGRSRGKKILIF